MELNCSSPDPLCSSPGFRVPSTSSQRLSPTSPLLALPLSIAKEQPDKISRKGGTGLQQVHAQLSVLHRRGGLSNLRKGTSRSFHISSYRRSQSLVHFGARLQYLTERRTIRTSFQCTTIRKTEFLLASPIKTDMHLVISRKGRSSLPLNPVLPSASLRKAQSLRAVAESDSLDDDENLVPTEPATPCNPSPSMRVGDDLSCMPVLSPVVAAVPHFPLSAEVTAKIRIAKYKEREGRTIDHDYSRMKRTDNTLSALPRAESDWESFMGLGDTTREKHLNWFFHFLPEDDTENSFSSASSVVSLDSRSRYSRFNRSRQNLINQLTTSPETRFHAALLFLRYHWLLGLNRPQKIETTHLPLYPSSGIWDITLASLAISVKFHRDFLFPLVPIEATEYLDISPHNMDYEALEYAQHTMLDAFSYELGITPQPILDQLWIALPSLRELFGFAGGWNQVKKETWRHLFTYLSKADVMRFPVSVLTTAAVSRSLVLVLTERYYYESDWNSFSNYTHLIGQGRDGFEMARRFRDAAVEDAEGVILDIQAVVGVSQMEVDECLQWSSSDSGRGV